MPTRLENLLHYIISVVPPAELGATKLAKIVWFSDVEYYRLHGETITKSDNYQRKDQGPLHVDFYRSVDALKGANKITERTATTMAGPRREYVWIEPPQVDDFTGPEIAVVHNVINYIQPLSATQASDLTHGEPWFSALDREAMPVRAAAVVWGEVDDDDMAWTESIAREHSAPA
ncbi:MAG: DUF4065 domain-containing protein [Rhodospirillaceae bacterium]|nr:DUF4065 domain-containing protein [Rhodospirillaceae bacterium]